MALVASVLVWATPTQAQNAAPPIAIATVSSTDGVTGNLNGVSSFDPGGGIAAFKWVVVTEAYSWVSITDDTTSAATFTIPTTELAARYGQTIEFKLTVTDNGSPAAQSSDTTTYNINQRPNADIAVEANLEDRTSAEEGADRYTIDAVIDGPGENGNADNEWDVMEGALVVLDGTGSSDPNGRVTGYAWSRIYPATGDEGQGFVAEGMASKLSTDTDTEGVQTVDNLTADQSPFYVYYTLRVTDSGATPAATDPSAVVKIVVHDQPAAPKAALFATTDVDDPDEDGDEEALAKAKLSDENPANNAEAYGDLQESRFPSDTPRFIVSPNTVIALDASDTADTDDIAGETTTIVDYSWDGARRDSTTSTRATLKVDKDAEDGTVLTVTVTATDDSDLSGSASIEFLVVDDNTVPVSSTGARDDMPLDLSNLAATAGNQYVTADGAQGGDVKNSRPTGRVTFRGIGFDPDQPVGTLIYAWNELTTDETKTAKPGVINPDIPLLSLIPTKRFWNWKVPSPTRFRSASPRLMQQPR